MSDLTPPKFWESLGHANYWLGEFIEEVAGPLRYHDLFRLPPLVFDTVRDGWKSKVVLKKRFVNNPEALEEFIRYQRMSPELREAYRQFCNWVEEGD